ncbi:Pom152p [Lachancea thermotolerans CBS 6340]|uniref:KLTH0E09284p n=1 Tax=Lachancea thermotolerans (strain ATCC 56472 / CBS 6340 / NRRL Y-8284) TaxID=559295 RepID=C5DI31_LACTC|nr:KLTH0E09284p [Lachancea thermotolerans CBS 6340]CAR23442.1 KLTH0E09284p [Lachancea thermotolerans CBS 6340]
MDFRHRFNDEKPSSARLRERSSSFARTAWHDSTHEMSASRKDDLPLISTEVLDIPSQRALVVAVFAIIQAYKLYDLILLKSGLPVAGVLLTSSRFNFISKYLVIDSLFLYFLPGLKIPKLTFRPVAVLLQIMAVTATTVFLSNEQNFPLLTFLVSAWTKFNAKELSLTGGSVSQRKLVDPASHFKGAHTIKILPENTAMLNPFHDSFCINLDGTSVDDIHIPLRINSTSELDFVQLEYHSLDSPAKELLNFTKKQLVEVPRSHELFQRDRASHHNSIRYFLLPVEEIGLYKVKQVIDSKKFHLRLYKSEVIIPHCPWGVIAGLGNFDRCVGDSNKVSIEVHGVPPMELEYTRSLNGESSKFVDSSLQPEYFDSPLMFNQKAYTAENLADLKWARSYPVTINLEALLKDDGVHSYTLQRVVDGFGNKMDFSGLSSSLLEKYGLSYSFKVHDLPKATLDSKFDHNSPTKRSLEIKFESSRDWDDAVPYKAAIEVINDSEERSILEYELKKPVTEIPIDQPGTYRLESVGSKFCSGIVVDKSNILVTQPIPPRLEVKSTPILDQCVGQVGLNFDLTFTGVPPFYYRTKIYKIEGKERKLHDAKKFTSQGTRNQFHYSPSSEGNYEIVFDQISNTLFTKAIPLSPVEDYTFKTSMRVKPDAAISSHYATQLCLGSRSKVPVAFKGEPPFSLEYDILETSTNKRVTYSLNDINSFNYDLQTPVFDVGGDYILSLVSVKDTSGCLVGLSSSDARIEVRRDVPSAGFNSFENHDVMLIKEGAFAELPLSLSGVAPFTVSYQHFDSKGEHMGTYDATFMSSYKAGLKVEKEGTYKLMSVKDRSCLGKISESKEFSVAFLEKPGFKVLEHNKLSKHDDMVFAKDDVCENFEETVDLVLSGSAPFVLSYELMSPSGQIASRSIQVATKFASIKLPNDRSGQYTLTVKGVSDSHYTEKDLAKIGFTTLDVVVKQHVRPLPAIGFAEPGKTFRTCSADVDNLSGLEKIALHVKSGRAPFSVSFSIYHESTSKTDYVTIDNVTKKNFDFSKLFKGLKLGTHIVTMGKVVDANGCTSESGSDKNHILISITDVPRISLAEPNMEFCVGDYVAYQLSGLAPFNIKYEFNGVPLKSKERTSQFVRLASEAGIISVLSLQDSASQCLVNFTRPGMEREFEALSLVVHPIPSVTVSRGDYIVEDIHEGDQAEIIFSFEGTPPFSLTYVRTEEVDDKRGKKRPQIVETHKVEDIYSYEYRTFTSLQGRYEAIAISDAYCFAKNNAYFA